MKKLKCPKCGAEEISCGGLNPVQCSASCRNCGFSANGMLKISYFFEAPTVEEGKRRFQQYMEEQAEAERKRQAEAEASKVNEDRHANCSHQWKRRVQSGVAYLHCSICGAEKVYNQLDDPD